MPPSRRSASPPSPGIFGPVFFALVLTICVHPLRVWLEKRGVPRGIATGSVITAVTLLLLGFGYLVLIAFGQFAELLPQFKDQIAAFGQDVAAWLTSIGINADEIERRRQGIRPGDAARVRRRPCRRSHGLDHAPRHPLHDAAAHGHGCRVRADRAAGAVPGTAARRGLARELRQQRAPVHGGDHGARDGAGHHQLDRVGHPRRARRVHLGTARVRLLLHPEHRLLHRDHPADHLRRARRRAGPR